MDRYRSLFKENSSMLSPRQHIKINREIRNEIRAKNRQDNFHFQRNIVSPSPLKTLIASASSTPHPGMMPLNNESDKGAANVDAHLMEKSPRKDALRIAKVASMKNGGHLTRLETFLQRFVNWKEAKQKTIEIEKQRRRRPFISACSNGASFQSAAKTQGNRREKDCPSFAPKNHKFKPPSGLRKPVVECPPPVPSLAYSRKILFTVVTTPQKNKPNCEHKTSKTKLIPADVASKVLDVQPDTKLAVGALKPSKNIVGKTTLPQQTTPALTTSTTTKTKKLLSGSVTAVRAPQKLTPRQLVVNAKKLSENVRSVNGVSTRMTRLAAAKLSNINATISTGAIGKTKQLQTKRFEVPKPSKKNSNLTVNLKAKKKTAAIKTLPKNKLTSEMLINVCSEDKISPSETTSTSSSTTLTKPSDTFLTSTAIKPADVLSKPSGQVHLKNLCEDLSRVEETRKTSAKRATLRKKIDKTDKKVQNSDIKNKFNFKRYSQLDLTVLSLSENSADNAAPSKDLDDETMKPNTSPKTPPKDTAGDRPLNYLSPYVSVSRGKVNSRTEKEKRNSIYLASKGNGDKSEVDEKVETRRILEAVHYFRNQLNNETARLEGLCQQWEDYKLTKTELLQESGGVDMIDATTGQTKLLTSKKFMQFKSLIDRCESCATGEGVVDDGSEKTKLVTEVDLEGFWSMLGLQVENINRRFSDLCRWRSNDWVDPDSKEIANKAKKSLNKVCKPKMTANVRKAKPNSALMELIRNAKANKNKASITNMKKTPPKNKRRSRSGTPNLDGRISVVVQDRKSRSIAPTVISISARKQSEPSELHSSMDSPTLLNQVEMFKRSLSNLHDSCLRKDFCITKHAKLDLVATPTLQNGRKSILKTPGTAKGKQKTVIFDKKLHIKKFNFQVDDNEDSSNGSP